jgi:hypothetical protein
MNPEEREREIREVVAAMLRHLNDLPDLAAKYEALDRLDGWLALIERGQLPEAERRQ